MTSFEIPDSDLRNIKDQVVIITGKLNRPDLHSHTQAS
jgi:hypothetical protein